MRKKILVIFLGLMVLGGGGCRTVREKFVREKSAEREAPVYVTFKEYSDKPTRQVYIDYYLYTRGWLGALVEALEKGVSHKRQRHAAGEALMNLEQIISFFNQEGKDAAAGIHQELKEIEAQIREIPNLSRIRRNSLIRKTQRLKREFRANYTYTKAKEWLN